ncbi:MAG: hypothetical protein IKQ95_05830 [Synergistaceae bacterium]|nr:hypothetical protein [Synergistaceae bacterium]
MRKFRMWSMIAVIGIFVAVLSGCGGGSLDSTNSGNQDTLNIPDTYRTQEVLSGAWSAIDSTSQFSAGNFGFRLSSARLTFDSVDMSGSVAYATVGSAQEWHTSYTSGDEHINLGIQNLGLTFSNEAGRMIHQAKDKWRCNVDGDSAKTLMNITVSSDKIIRVNYQGVTPAMYAGYSAEYSFTLNFRKEE